MAFLNNLKEDEAAKKHNLIFLPKTDDTNASFKNIWQELHGSNANPRVGMIAGDTKTGPVAEGFMQFL